jgi:two-component system phosphate regulon response regulator OmpR
MSTEEGEAPHILVVDDDARLRQLLHRYLVQNG